MATRIVANRANMRRHYRPGVVAHSPRTGETCSANPADYWWLPDHDGEYLSDRDGNPMILARRTDPRIIPL